jgi:hypothetical protein
MDIETRFPITIANASGGRVGGNAPVRFAKAVTTLEAGMKAGQMANADFVEVKSILSAIIERAWETVRDQNDVRGPAQNNLPEKTREFLWSVAFMNGGIAGFYRTTTKRLEKAPSDAAIQPFVQAAKAFLAEIKPIAEAFEFFKDKSKLVKRAVKTDAEREAAFAPPPVTMASTIRVRDLLESVVAEEYAALLNSLADYYTIIRTRCENAIASSEKPFRAHSIFQKDKKLEGLGSVVYYFVKDSDTYPYAAQMVPQAESDAFIAMQSKRDADHIRTQFVNKNLRKIVSILEAKEKAGVDLKDLRVISRHVSMNGLTGSFYVDFTDGSGFEFTNSVVYSFSTHGKMFQRFPLTFHNVKLAGGVKMPRPSEERMNTVFLGKEKA